MDLGEDAHAWIHLVLTRSKFAQALGIEVVEAEPDRVVLKMPFREEFTTVGAIVHGGAIATLIDIAAASASASGIRDGEVAGGATASMNISYLAAADGADLTAEAAIIQRSRRQTVADIDIRDQTGALVAKGVVTSRFVLKR
ncbi:PaaI family thioesterase [Pikeienuella sp. HZG-20]|uniref:PaaI family thioesterase n=1 Tax=Paludibacillus litoralis TaxID=3133267 RepID=UPI0030EB4005